MKKQEALCLELGSRRGLGHCYANWGPLARAQGDHPTARDKLQAALDIFTELKMPPERDESSCRTCEDRSLTVAAQLALRISRSACFSASGVNSCPDNIRPISRVRPCLSNSSIPATVRPLTSRFSTQ